MLRGGRRVDDTESRAAWAVHRLEESRDEGRSKPVRRHGVVQHRLCVGQAKGMSEVRCDNSKE